MLKATIYSTMLASLPIPLIRILFFCLVPIGIYLLIISIGLVRKGFGGEIIVEIPFTTRRANFTIPKPGSYSIWQQAPLFHKVPIDAFRPVITHQSTGEKVMLSASLSRASSSDGSVGRMKLFTFLARAGDHTLELTEGSSISALESIVVKAIPAREVTARQYFIQVREDPPSYYSIVGIPLIVVSGLFIIGGFVLGILAHQIVR
jgi:hypothetical protein